MKEIWIVIIAMGIGTFGLRFLFLGLVGDREMPPWVLRHLRYTAVAILPALVTPLVVWPQATNGALDPPRLMAAVVTLALGLRYGNVLLAIGGGAVTLYGALYLLG